MFSVVEICNMAAGAIGVNQLIASIDELSPVAVRCKLFYEPTRDYVLRDFDWPFARRYLSLGLVTENPNTDWTYAYRYPVDCLNLRGIVGASRREIPPTPYQIGSDTSGRLVYTDQYQAVARCTVRITDPALFDPIFAAALAYLLGSRIAPGVARDPKFVSQAFSMYLATLASARAVAANESGHDAPTEAESIRARE